MCVDSARKWAAQEHCEARQQSTPPLSRLGGSAGSPVRGGATCILCAGLAQSQNGAQNLARAASPSTGSPCAGGKSCPHPKKQSLLTAADEFAHPILEEYFHFSRIEGFAHDTDAETFVFNEFSDLGLDVYGVLGDILCVRILR